MASFAFDSFTTTAQTLTDTETGFVGQNGSIWTTGFDAITALGSNHDLVINGTVASNFDAISAFCDNLDLVVGAQGNILSTGVYGLYANVTASSEVVNNGAISSAQDTGVALFALDTSARHTLVNTGTISGEDNGVRIEARGPTSTITNSGVIAGGDYGIHAGYTTDAVLEIWNTGTISGSEYSFYGHYDDGSGTSSDQVHNAGLMQGDIALHSGDDLYDGIGGLVLGTVDGGAGNDTLIGGSDTDIFLGGTEADLIRGRGGDDQINGGGDSDTLRGGGGNDYVFGGSGEDRIFGGAGSDELLGGNNNDRMFGGDGNDEMTGGLGADRQTGGAGADTFIYTAAAESPAAGGFDIITDFTSGEDQIDLSGIVGPELTFIGSGAFSGTQGEVRFVTNSAGNTSVFADVDGDGAADMRILLLSVDGLEQGDFLL